MARILIAEDDQFMLRFLIMGLEKAGYDVIGAADGLKALEAFKKEPESFDLLLTDIVMPGMDGVELAKRIKKTNADIKIMYITGFAAISVDQKNTSRNQDAPKTLSKPFHLNELIEQVDTVLKAKT